MTYAYSDAIQPPPDDLGMSIKPAWLEQFRSLYIVHCECKHYFAIECDGTATVWRMGSIGKCREIEVELSCQRCGRRITYLWVYPLSRLPRTPSRAEVWRKFDKLALGEIDA